MTAFSRGKPITTTTSQITVDGLAPGRHRFTLVVRDTGGNVSREAAADVIVLEGLPPPNPIFIREDGITRPEPRPVGPRIRPA